MDDCVFCRIAKGEIPATVHYENDKVIAIQDIHPVGPVHVLILPREHVADLSGITSGNRDLMGEIAFAAQAVAKKLGIAESGYRLISNNGPDAGQSVPHLHFHLVGGRKLGLKIL